jgi:hypothetical protein
MARSIVEPDASGELQSQNVPSGASHTFVLRTVELDHP